MEIKKLDDGVYTVSLDAVILSIEGKTFYEEENSYEWVLYITKNGAGSEKLENYIKSLDLRPERVFVASAYGTEQTFLILDEKPIKLTTVQGSGFNYGSTNIIEVKKPCVVLILAEDD